MSLLHFGRETAQDSSRKLLAQHGKNNPPKKDAGTRGRGDGSKERLLA
ncbi:MAG: hypothetical protein F6J86_10380 [Symploca sp. SIO1B1]|nr:hypothetical protein [Symploca sp. SIO1C2]NER94229.1 hypothetical protein [Symploca sp. SIO1B1]